MPRNEELYRSVLSSLGLSQEKIDYITTRHDPVAATRIYWLGFAAYIPMAAGLMMADVRLSDWLFSEYLMRYRTQGLSVILYSSFHILHPLFTLGFGIVFPAYIIYRILENFPKASELVALKSIDDMIQRTTVRGIPSVSSGAALAKSFIDDTFRQLPIHEALLYYNRRSLRWSKHACIVATILLVLTMALDIFNYVIMTPEGVQEMPFGSFRLHKESWNGVNRVETGCYVFDRRNGPRLQYDIIFNDGTDIDMFDMGEEDEDRQLKGILQVDAIITKMGKSIQVGKIVSGVHGGEPYFNKECFAGLKEMKPMDYPKLIPLLRLEKYLPQKRIL